MIYRNLRYVLEMMAQAYDIDSKYPNVTVAEQGKKAEELEEKTFGWGIVKSVLMKVLDLPEKEIQERFHSTWRHLNKHAHASAKQMAIILTVDPASLVTDSFDEELARKALEVIDEIFDLVYVMIFRKFPKIKELALGYKFIKEWEQYLPNTTTLVKTIS